MNRRRVWLLSDLKTSRLYRAFTLLVDLLSLPTHETY